MASEGKPRRRSAVSVKSRGSSQSLQWQHVQSVAGHGQSQPRVLGPRPGPGPHLTAPVSTSLMILRLETTV